LIKANALTSTPDRQTVVVQYYKGSEKVHNRIGLAVFQSDNECDIQRDKIIARTVMGELNVGFV